MAIRTSIVISIDIWYYELEGRFRETLIIALAKLESLRYLILDVRARKDPEEYI